MHVSIFPFLRHFTSTPPASTMGMAGLPILAALLVSGCLSIPVSRGRPSSEKEPGSLTTIRTAEIDSIVPVVKRSGTGGFDISFEAVGTFERETFGTVVLRTSPSEHIAVGLFPGLAEDSASDAAGNALTAFWYNLCFAGAPTVYGILLEPFFGGYSSPQEATDTMGGRAGFARAPLIGFYKFQREGTARTERVSTRDTLRSLPLDTLSIQSDDSNVSILHSSQGCLTILPRARGRREFKVRLSIASDDPLARYLTPFLEDNPTFTVILPE